MTYNPPIGSIYHLYTTYIFPIGWLYITYHLLKEPGNSIDHIHIFVKRVKGIAPASLPQDCHTRSKELLDAFMARSPKSVQSTGPVVKPSGLCNHYYPENLGKLYKFDKHIFQLGWNHQLVMIRNPSTRIPGYFLSFGGNQKKRIQKTQNKHPQHFWEDTNNFFALNSNPQIVEFFRIRRAACLIGSWLHLPIYFRPFKGATWRIVPTICKGSHNPRNGKLTITMVMNHLLTGMILQV